jgi:hypothetical protein
MSNIAIVSDVMTALTVVAFNVLNDGLSDALLPVQEEQTVRFQKEAYCELLKPFSSHLSQSTVDGRVSCTFSRPNAH